MVFVVMTGDRPFNRYFTVTLPLLTVFFTFSHFLNIISFMVAFQSYDGRLNRPYRVYLMTLRVCRASHAVQPLLYRYFTVTDRYF